MAEPISYQDWAAWLRKKYPEKFGPITDDRALVEEAMSTWPTTNYRDMFGDSSYAELKGLHPGGGAGPQAGIMKQLGFNASTMLLNTLPLPEAYAAAKLNPVDDETLAAERGMSLPEYKERKKDAVGPESWSDWYLKQMGRTKDMVTQTGFGQAKLAQDMMWKGLQQIPGLPETAVVEAEKTRKYKDQVIDDWIERDVELQGHLNNVDENPITIKNLLESDNKREMVGRGFAQAFPSMVAFLGASYLGGPAAGMGVAFGLGKGSSYDETMAYLVDELGMDPKDAIAPADKISTAVGAGEMVLEAAGGMSVAKALGLKKQVGAYTNRFLRDKFLKSFKEGTVRSWSIDALKSTFMEGATEMSQEMNSFLGQEAVKQGYGITGDEALANLLDEYGKFATSPSRMKEVFKEARAEEAGIIGAGMGFGGGLPGGARATVRRSYERFIKGRKKEKALKKEVQDKKEEVKASKIPKIEVDDNPILLKRLIDPDKMTEAERKRGDELYGAWGFRDEGKALDWIVSLVSDRDPGAIEDAGFTYADLRAGMRAQFTEGVPGYDARMATIDKLLDQIESGERVIPGTKKGTPLKQGKSLEELDAIEEAKGEQVKKRKKPKEDVADLFPERDVSEPVTEPVTEPDEEPVTEPQEFIEEPYQDPDDLESIIERNEEIIEKFEKLDETPIKDPPKHLEQTKDKGPPKDTYDYDAYKDEFKDKTPDKLAGDELEDKVLQDIDEPITEPEDVEDIGQQAKVDFSKVDLGTEASAEVPVEFKPGDKVEYNGKEWELRGINEAGFAQLTDLATGKKFSGTPKPDKLTLIDKVDPPIEEISDEERNEIRDMEEKGWSKEEEEAFLKEEISKEDQYLGDFQARMTKGIEEAASPNAKKWVPKEQVKTKVATQYIGEGKEGSSTDRYKEMYAREGKANTGKYTADDVVYVSSNGARPGRFNPVKDGVLQGNYKNIDKAIAAGADIIMDDVSHLRATKKYNVGEMALGKYLAEQGYERIGETGRWRKKTSGMIEAGIKALAEEPPWEYDKREEYRKLDKKLKKETEEYPIYKARKHDLNYTSDQSNVLKNASSIASEETRNKPKGEQRIYSGYAGTGKTTIVENIATEAKNNHYKVYIGAPTNKAVRRLEEVTKKDNPEFNNKVNFTTMHALLYEGMDKQTRNWKPNSDLGPNDFIIIDESSMISQELYDEIQKNALGVGAKVIFLGDSFQLKPVGKDPLILRVPDVQLTEVRRQALTSNILKFATSLRMSNPDHLAGIAPNIFLPPVGRSGEVAVVPNASNLFLNDLKEGKNVVYITHSNDKRVNINQKARYVKYGAKSAKEEVLPGDQIIYVGNAKYLNGETGTVGKDVEILSKSTIELEWWDHKTKKYRIDKVPAVFYKDGVDKVLLIPGLKLSGFRHQDVLSGYPQEFQLLDKDGNLTGSLDPEFNLATNGYAITAHKSQGSEWDTVYVDYDTAGNSKWAKKISNDPRWLYTAATRAKKNLIIQDIPSLNHLTWEQMDKIVGVTPKKTMPGLDGQDNVNESLQKIAIGQRISQDLDLFRAIADKLSKTHPYITVSLLEKVFSKHGIEVAGKAIDKAIEVSMSKGAMNTLPHEYMEVYLDLMQDDKFIMDALKRQKADTFKEAKHQLATHTQNYLVGRIKDKSLKKRTELFLRRFWKQFKALFTRLNDTELYDLIAERFYRGKGASTAAERAPGGVESLQPVLTTVGMTRLFAYFDEMWFRTKNAAAKVKIVDRWKSAPDINDFIKQVQTMLVKADASQVHSDAFIQWVESRFPDNKFYEWTRQSSEPLSEPRLFISQLELQQITETQLDDVVEGLVSRDLGPDDFDLRSADFKLENRAIKELGLILTTTEANDLFYKARDVEGFGEFMTFVRENFVPYPTSDDKMWIQRYYISRRSTIEVNRDDRVGNRRTNVLLDQASHKLSVIQSTDPTRFDRKNLQWDKTNLLERVNNSELVWLSGEDVYIKKAPDWYQETYGFINAEDLVKMEADMQKHRLVPVFTRGEKPQLAFVEWNNEHEKKAANAEAYWKEKYAPTDGSEPVITYKQALNFMGEGMKRSNITQEFLAGEIARFEAYEDMYPGLLKTGDGASLLKRAKIPTTPVTIVEEARDMNAFTFDPTNVSFVNRVNGHVQPAMIQVEGHEGLKYIYDGASLTSKGFFNEYETHAGLEAGTEHLKTVVYHKGSEGHISMKHQHFMRQNLEVWDNHGEVNARLIATIDANGNITTADGQAIDILNTHDESKITSFENETVISIPATSIGLVKLGSVHDTGRHPMQWWNYIRDANAQGAFKKHFIPKIKDNLRDIFKLVRGGTEIVDDKEVRKEAWEYVHDLVKKLDGNMPDYATNILVEKARLRAGTNADMAGILNTIVATKMIQPAIQMSDVPGSILEFIPNTDGRIEEGHMALPKSNAKHIIERYKEATGDNKADVKNVNRWLKSNEIYDLVYRSPIPYFGGAAMFRVSYLHENNNIVELHYNDLFGRFEGDNDGDTLHIEAIDSELQNIFRALSDSVPLTTIDLNKYSKKKMIDISSRKNLYDLIGEMTYGSNAVSQIANIQNIYGQLQDTFYSFVMENDLFQDEKILLRDPSSMSPHPVLKNETVTDMLRYFLQAALDNAKFLMLKDLGYERNDLIRMLFVTEEGQEITPRQFQSILPLINLYLEAPRLRNGRTHDKSYDTTTSLLSSKAVQNFAQHRKDVYREAYRTYLTENKIKKDGQMVLSPSVRKVKEINFKKGISVIESVVTTLAEVWDEEYQSNPDSYAGIEEHSIFEKNYSRHSELHVAAMNKVNSRRDVLAKMLAQDKDVNIPNALKQGDLYALDLVGEYFGSMGADEKGKPLPSFIEMMEDMGPNAWDKNEVAVKFADKWGKRFDELSYISQVQATIKFLNANRVTSKFPPYGQEEKLFPLLHGDVMLLYNTYYNEVSKEKSLNVSYNKKGDVILEKQPGILGEVYDTISKSDTKYSFLNKLLKVKEKEKC